MNNHCWRDSTSVATDDGDKTWPKLSEPSLRKTRTTESVSHVRTSETDDSRDALNAIEYPKLGEIVPKFKRSFRRFRDSSEISTVYGNNDCGRLRRLKSTDSVQIDLQKTLEKHKWPLLFRTDAPAKITIDVCKLNVNMRVENFREGESPISKSKQNSICRVNKKRPSRLKWLIMYERTARLCSNGVVAEAREPENRLEDVNFEGLRINATDSDETELAKRMSSLNCYDARNYRRPREINVADDNPTFRPDLHEEMLNLSLESSTDSTDDRRTWTNVGEIKIVDVEATASVLSPELRDLFARLNGNMTIEELPGRINYSRKFREYCTNLSTPELKNGLREFLAEISRLQRKMYEKDSTKGRSKRRYYAGIKEVRKHVDLKKIKFLVIAPDLERVKIEGGLDDMVLKLIESCNKNKIPYCFGLDRRKLGYYIHGKGFVSCIGISNYSGAEEKLKNVLLAVVEARNGFARLVGDEAKTIDVQKLLPKEELLLSEIINAYLKIIANNI